jgi:hypothetical protein
MNDLKEQWIQWNANNPKDKIDWCEFLEEHQS